MTRLRTGKNLPRNYGLHIKDDAQQGVFVTPLAYALGTFMLEREQEIQRRIHDYAYRHNLPFNEVNDAFVEGLVAREKSQNLLTYARRTPERIKHQLVLKGLRVHAGKIIGQVKTKSRHAFVPFEQQIPGPYRNPSISFAPSRVFTRGNFFHKQKGNFSFTEPHLAAAEIAYHLDYQSALGVDENISGLDIQRLFGAQGLPTLPFGLHTREQNHALTDLVINYYLEKQKQYDANKQALINNDIYSKALVDEIVQESGHARFEVIQEEAQTRNAQAMSSKEQERLGATSDVLTRINDVLRREGFVKRRYTIEFPGTPHEVVAERYEPTDRRRTVYSLFTTDDGLPLLVRKTLGEKLSMWNKQPQEIITSSLKDKVGRDYETIDDTTRRAANAHIVLPDERLAKENIRVPERLRRCYDQLRQ